MRRALFLGCAIVLFAQAASAQQFGVTLVMGAFAQEGDYLKQTLSLTNKSGRFYHWVTTECGFFDHDRLVATSSDLTKNLSDGTTGFATAVAYTAAVGDKVDNVQCRIAGVD